MLHRQTATAFSLIEALIGIVVVGIVVGALYTGFTQGMVITQMTREDSRATQILLEKSEALRLVGWGHIISNNVPTTFTAYYDPQSPNSGAVYRGSIGFAVPAMPLNYHYKTNLREVRISVAWNTGDIPRQRALTTMVARYGLQSYVY